MSLKDFGKAAAYTGGILVATGLALAAVFGQYAAFTPADGAEFLEDKGYTQVVGGEADYINFCGKSTIGRSYTAIHPSSGEQVDRTVCYDYLWGPHLPGFGIGQ